MKKALLLSLGVAVSAMGFAQIPTTAYRTYNHTVKPITPIAANHSNSTAKTTGVGDTLLLSNFPSPDTIITYSVGTNADSGYVTGTNAYGDMGFAERYDINTSGTIDSAVQVLGVAAVFNGTVNPASTKTVNFKIWSQGAQVEAPFNDPNILESGFPNTVLASQSVAITQLGIPDTLTEHIFSTPTSALTSSFFTGYEINYSFSSLNGDTIGLITTIDGERLYPEAYLSGSDTIINNQNVTEFSDGTWHDNATDNFAIFNSLAIFPIVVIESPTGVANVKTNNLTFYGNYPNPAVNSTNIKFSLNAPADVTIQITDMAGRAINTIKQSSLSVGEHIIPVQTNTLSAGNYLYVIRTSNGDGIASKFTVTK